MRNHFFTCGVMPKPTLITVLACAFPEIATADFSHRIRETRQPVLSGSCWITVDGPRRSQKIRRTGGRIGLILVCYLNMLEEAMITPCTAVLAKEVFADRH